MIHRKALVLGAGGFIGSNLVTRLKELEYYVVGIDLKYPDFSNSKADEFIIQDLRDQNFYKSFNPSSEFDEVYQLSCLMGGAGFLFTGLHDADIMGSVIMNVNILNWAKETEFKGKLFYSSSACVYPEYNQLDKDNPNCEESTVYPACPDSEYGWEKLFSERLYSAFAKNYGIDIRIGRFHNIFGIEGTWTGGKEKSPAAICRKISEVEDGGEIEIWGDGEQTRSFLYIDECLDGVRKLMDSEFKEPINIGSDEIISINNLAVMVAGIADKHITIKHIPGPLGVRGRTSDNNLIKEKLNWCPSIPLIKGMEKTYNWILKQSHTKTNLTLNSL